MGPMDGQPEIKAGPSTSLDGSVASPRPPAASFDEPRRFRKYTSLSSMRAGEGSSFRGLFSLSKADKSPTGYNASSIREVDFLREEVRAAQDAVRVLAGAVKGAQSFREKSSKLLEEAHRALGRLEQAVSYNSDDRGLINVACEIKCVAQRGITLVSVYGKYSTLGKVATLFLRSYIHKKFDKQAGKFKSLLPGDFVRGASTGSKPQPVRSSSLAGAASIGGASAANGGLPSPTGSLAPGSAAAGLPNTGSMHLPNAPSHAPSHAPSGGGGGGDRLGSLQRTSQSSAHPLAAPGPIVGNIVRANKHDRVHAMAYVPGTQTEYVCLWWSAGQMLEFYSGAVQSTTGFPIEKPSLNVTALAIDEGGNVWTGHAKGLVRVRNRQQWEYMVEDRAFSSAVKAITFDEAGRAWVGDEGGRIKVLGYDPRAGRLETVASLQRSPALLAKMKVALADNMRGLFGKRCGGNGQITTPAAGAFATATAAAVAAAAAAGQQASPGGPDSSAAAGNGNGQGQPVAIEGPVRCIFLRGGRAWTSGGGKGGSGGWLQMWDASSFQDLDVYDCCTFGPCHAMAALRWPSGATNSGQSANPPSVSPATSGAHHRYTNSDGARSYGAFPATGAAAASSSGGPQTWRLLTGHENGQLLLWHPEHNVLAPLLRIGEACSPCRGIAVFECCRLLATAHQNGELHLFMQPTSESSLPPGANSAAPSTFGILRPRMVTIQAHRSRVDRMIFNGISCATTSNLGTIRVWFATELAMEAQRQGLLTHTISYGSLSLSAIGTGCGAAAGAMSTAGSMQSRATGSASLGDLAPSGSLQYGSAQYARDSAKRLGSVSELRDDRPTGNGGDSAIAAAIAAAGAGPPPPLGVSPSMSVTTVSSVLSPTSQPSLQSQQLQQIMPVTALSSSAGGPVSVGQSQAIHHKRDSSRDSNDAGVAGVAAQSLQNSDNIAASDAAGSTAPQAQSQGLAGPANFPHFQSIDASELNLVNLIGSGAYGKVWLADWTGCQVAVKELFGLQGGQAGREKEYSALVNEVTLLGSLSHPNIMRFLAVVPDPPLIVMQYYPHGSLFDLLTRARRGSAKAAKELSWDKRLGMLRDVAAGMQYLHSRKPPVIHGDLRSPNLLLDLTIDRDRPRFHVKIADFGLARMVTGASGSVAVSKTTNPRWTAPEVLQRGSVGKAADVFSFSVIMWEILTWQQPYADMLTVQVMYNTVVENSRPEVPPSSELPGSPGPTLPQYLQLMESCWHPDASKRPSFKDIVEQIQVLQQMELESARQMRQQYANGRYQRGPGDTRSSPNQARAGAGGPAVAASPAEAPGNGGNAQAQSALGVAAAAAGGAPPRRPGGAGIASPFSQPAGLPAASAAAPEADPTRPQNGTAAQDYAQQHYGSLLPLYGMSPILEEQMSYSSAAGAAGTSAAAALPGAEMGARAAAPNAASTAAAAAVQHLGSPRPAQLQQPAAQPHVHFAASAFAADAAQPYFPSPPSPALATRPRSGGSAATRPHIPAPSSASSTESGPVHPVSGGGLAMAGGAHSNASSRHSSASTSGRVAGAAAAALGPAAPPGVSGTAGWRRPVSSTGSAATGGRAGVVRGGTGHAAAHGPHSGTVARTAVRRSGSIASGSARTSGTGEPTSVFDASPPPVAGVPSLSPFAGYPSHHLGDSAATQHSPASSVTGPTSQQLAGASPFVAPAQDEQGRQPGAGEQSAAAPPAVGASHVWRHGSTGTSSNMASSGSSFRARIPARSVGAGPSSLGNVSAAPRGAGAVSKSQPGTPPYRGPAGSTSMVPRGHVPPDGRSSAGRSGIPTAALLQSLLTIQHDTEHQAGATAPASPALAASGEPPAIAGSRTPASYSRTSSITSGHVPSGPSLARHSQGAPLGSGSLPRRALPHSLSQSSSHSHVAGPGQGAGAAAGGGDGRSAYRRMPSGGSISGPVHGASGAVSSGGHRSRELSAVAARGYPSDVASPSRYAGAAAHPRTPATAPRSGAASPRIYSSTTTEPHSVPRGNGVRRNNSSLAAGPSAAGSPSASSSTHLSRLGASASGRQPASPRTVAPAGPPSRSGAMGPGAGSATHAPVSRIPTLSHGMGAAATAITAPLPSKSDTSRSLDDASFRRLEVVQAAAGSPAPVGSPSVAARGGASASPFAVAATAVWDDGLGVRMSPDATEELPYQPSADYPHLPQEEFASPATVTRGTVTPLTTRGSVLAPGSVAASQANPELLPLPPLPPRISTSRTTASPAARSTAASWEPPPLLSARAVGGVGSPFAAAAFTSPFHGGDDAQAEGHGQGTDTDTEASRTNSSPAHDHHAAPFEASPMAPRDDRLPAAAAAGTTEAGSSMWGAGFGSEAPVHISSTEWTAEGQPNLDTLPGGLGVHAGAYAPPARGPFAAAAFSPFAQHANEAGNWYGGEQD